MKRQEVEISQIQLLYMNKIRVGKYQRKIEIYKNRKFDRSQSPENPFPELAGAVTTDGLVFVGFSNTPLISQFAYSQFCQLWKTLINLIGFYVIQLISMEYNFNGIYKIVLIEIINKMSIQNEKPQIRQVSINSIYLIKINYHIRIFNYENENIIQSDRVLQKLYILFKFKYQNIIYTYIIIQRQQC
ncbi:Hypothetical_protein [Hexamita inflata]|uniref:Hypothetical_protein n=1 Tax=Hexamita inflata TaxID=28002 RepID=A0AA86PPM2_9EUKA|nr:Hypothetical protein HINF_LOCUS30056 [Hexamita inflata]